MLILKDIEKKYISSKKYILKKINLAFNDTGLVSILGKSGSGKTTLLNIISGLDKPTKGEVFIDRKNIKELKKNKTLYDYYIGFVFQDYNLINNMTVSENISLLKKIKIDKLLKSLKLNNYEHKKINELSGGERQRIAIARAVAKDKKIILCDEPTGALDSENSKNIMKILKKISKTTLVIIVTHDEELANQYSDRIIRIKDGIIESDTDNIKIIEKKSITKPIKTKYSVKEIIKYTIKNIKNNKRRSIINIISLIIGLTSLLLVLSISEGFKQSIEYEEKNSLSEYPLFISKTSTNIERQLENINKEYKKDKDYIFTNKQNHINKIDKSLIEYINNIKHEKVILKNYLINNIILSTYNKNVEKEIEIITGSIPKKENEVLLIIDNNNMVDKAILNSINLTENSYKIKELLNYRFKIKRKEYRITCIAKFKEDSILYGLNGVFIKDNLDIIPNEIYIYPNDYNNKLEIITYLDNYKDLEYSDYSKSIKDISTTLIDSISIILIMFSIITLIVAALMNYILTLISITEKNKEIGILRVNGIDINVIKSIFHLEKIIVSFISVALSIAIVLILSIPLNELITTLSGLEKVILIKFKSIIIVSVLILFITIISTWIPLRKISKVKIVDNLKYN